MKTLIAFAALTASSLAIAGAPPAGTVYVDSFSFAGSGCPAGTVAPTISNDNKTLTLSFDQFIAEVLPNSNKSMDRKNCNLTVNLKYPQGYTYAVAKADYRGYVYLDRYVSATQKATYYFAGMANAHTYSSNIGGGNFTVDKNYLFTDSIPMESVVWAPCGETRALNINAEIRTENRRNRNGQGTITTDSMDLDVNTQLSLVWNSCR